MAVSSRHYLLIPQFPGDRRDRFDRVTGEDGLKNLEPFTSNDLRNEILERNMDHLAHKKPEAAVQPLDDDLQIPGDGEEQDGEDVFEWYPDDYISFTRIR